MMRDIWSETGGGFHRVERVLSFISSRQNWDSPAHPHSPAGECATPNWSGEGGTLAFWGGVGGVLISKRGHTLWYSTLWRILQIFLKEEWELMDFGVDGI
jgi:hypothetical protein